MVLTLPIISEVTPKTVLSQMNFIASSLCVKFTYDLECKMMYSICFSLY